MRRASPGFPCATSDAVAEIEPSVHSLVPFASPTSGSAMPSRGKHGRDRAARHEVWAMADHSLRDPTPSFKLFTHSPSPQIPLRPVPPGPALSPARTYYNPRPLEPPP
eukprot:390265-Prymnesium_polylepis.2